MTKDQEAFRTISEVASELNMPQHVFRFWETRFKQIKPLKRGGSRRYYRPDDVKLLIGIKNLLYVQGYTIKGVQKILKEKGVRFVANINTQTPVQTENNVQQNEAIDVKTFVNNQPQETVPLVPQKIAGGGQVIKEVLGELLECKRLLDQTR